MRTLCDTTELEVEQSRLLVEMDTAVAMTERVIAENKAATDQGEYQRHRNELVARFESAKDGYGRVAGEISDRRGKRKVYMQFISRL